MKNVNLDRRLMSAIETLICQSEDGLSEYELITRLDQLADSPYPKPDLSDPLLLFQHHFYLRHCLYLLQQSWQADNIGWLEITAVKIRLMPIVSTSDSQLPAEQDPLKSYYLDLKNLNSQSAESVQAMLNSFWNRLRRHYEKPEAFQVLGLSGNETLQQQKQRYRALAQEHHPDKGGDEQTFQAIQQAWDSLKQN